MTCTTCADVDETKLAEMIDVASDVLFELSLMRFPGVCEDTVRPCGARPGNDGPITFPDVGRGATAWRSTAAGIMVGCGCEGPRVCGCSRPSEITLGSWPVVAVSEVLVDGDVVDPSLYRIDDSRYLVRLPDTDGNNPGWPCCQDVTLASTELDTFEVTLNFGSAPPPSGKLAAEVLSCELTLACTPGAVCRLPRRVTQIVRQGVTETLLDPMLFLDDGKTGLYEVDLFLAAHGKQRKDRLPSAIVNPDIHRAVRRTGS